MSRTKPRSEFHFSPVQTAADLAYVPRPARDSEIARKLKGGPKGIAVAYYQAVGADSANRWFGEVSEHGTEDELLAVTDILAKTSMGSAYHLLVQPSEAEFMYRKIIMTDLVDPDTDERMSPEALHAKIAAGLARTAETADAIEHYVRTNQRPAPERVNEIMGRELAGIAIDLSAWQKGLPWLSYGAMTLQNMMLGAANETLQTSSELAGKLGARPTVAQLADASSPLRRYLYDRRDIMPKRPYDVLVEIVNDEHTKD